MKKNNNIRILEIVYILIMYTLILQALLDLYIPFLQYFDEFCAIMVILALIIYISINKTSLKIKKYDLIIVLFMILITIIGIYANLKYKFQKEKFVLIDIMLCFKFFMTYFMSSIIFKNKLKDDTFIATSIKILIVVMTIGTILNYIFNLNTSDYTRFGIRANLLFYGHPTALAASGVIILANYIRFSKKIMDKYIIMILLIIASTLRFKAIGFCVAFIFIALFIEFSNRRLKISKIMIISIIVILIAYQPIESYFLNDVTARNQLLIKSFEIAYDYFPTGTGFATYGSYYSGISYSPLYKMYGLNTVYGLTKEHPSFMSDNFWPMLLGQFGFIGTIMYAINIFLVFLKIQKEYKNEKKYEYLSKLLCLMYLIIASTAESSFVNSMGVPFAIIIAL